MVQPAVKEGRAADLNDAELVRRALERDPDAFRQIMQRHNRRLYRIARSVLRNDSEAEDAVQETYIAAFSYLATFRGESSLASWLSRIAMNEALGRLRRKRAAADFAPTDAVRDAEIIQFPSSAASDDPERSRGVHKQETSLVTSRMLGCFRDDAEIRQQFLSMIE